jgi:hypothetical protein
MLATKPAHDFTESSVNKVLKTLLAGFTGATAGLAAATAAHGAPRAESALECGIAADMAVVAHSLAHEAIDRGQADAIMVRIYDVSRSDRGKTLMRDIMDAAYRARAGGPLAPSASSGGTGGENSGQKFAEALFATCMESGGNMDPILGAKS